MEQILDSENDLEQRLHTYEPLWNEWVLTGKIIGKGEYTTDFEICRAANGTCEYAVLKAVNITAGDSDDVSLPISIVEQLRNSNRMIKHDNMVSYDDDLVYGVYDNNGKIISYDLLLREEYLTSILNIECSTFSSDESLLLRLAEDILTALLYSHEIGLYHGGIKPQNIFVASSGSFKLADFAVREIFSALIPNHLEDSQSITYLSPETAVTDGIGQSTAASDIYSFGLVLYYLLNNGTVPFSSNEGDTSAAVSKRLSGENILPPENGSKVLVNIVLKALAFRPEDRYRNAGEMLADIKALKEKTLDSTPQYTENNSRTESSYFTTTINADAETSFLRGPDKLYPDGVYSGSF
ncbi:MAG: protein kinase, partial [Lachnospiraceae bacterium]|nr:protein kinase [Lachnospiraceae bacterium]